MGSIFTKQSDIFDNQRRFQLESQKTQLERQAMMQELLHERLSAMEIGRSRDLTHYLGGFTALLAIGCGILAYRKREALYLTPIVLGACAAEYHQKIGFMARSFEQQEIASHLLDDQPELFALPNGPITIDEIDSRIASMKRSKS